MKGGSEVAKVITCDTLGFGCDALIRGETDEDLMEEIRDHIRTAHNIHNIPPDVFEDAQDLMREEG